MEAQKFKFTDRKKLSLPTNFVKRCSLTQQSADSVQTSQLDIEVALKLIQLDLNEVKTLARHSSVSSSNHLINFSLLKAFSELLWIMKYFSERKITASIGVS